MLIVGGLKEFRRLLGADHGTGGKHLWRLAGRRQALGNLRLKAVDEHTSPDGRSWRYWCRQPWDVYHRIARRRAGIQRQGSLTSGSF